MIQIIMNNSNGRYNNEQTTKNNVTMLGTQWTMDYKNNAQWTTMIMHNTNKNNIIMATITIQNVTMDWMDYNNNTQRQQWTMNN